MYFRSHYDLNFKKQNLDNPLIFEIDHTHLFKVIIRKRAEDDLRASPMKQHILEAYFESEMPPAYEDFLNLIHCNVVKPQREGEFFRYRKEDGSVTKYPQIGSEIIPIGFEDAITKLKGIFAVEAKNFISILRWRLDQFFKDNDIIPRKHQFSRDQQQWYPVPKGGPTVTVIDGWSTPANSLDEAVKQEILFFYSKPNDEGEPFYHPLFRDAWGQQEENPHSAIVMGIATIESAVKHCISNLNPEIEWFLAEINSPPVDTMLSRYLPKIMTKAPNNQLGIIPDDLRIIISKEVSARNKIVHTGRIPNTKGFKTYHQDLSGKVKELLLAIRDLLWLLDYYQGNVWALKYLRPETLKNIK